MSTEYPTSCPEYLLWVIKDICEKLLRKSRRRVPGAPFRQVLSIVCYEPEFGADLFKSSLQQLIKGGVVRLTAYTYNVTPEEISEKRSLQNVFTIPTGAPLDQETWYIGHDGLNVKNKRAERFRVYEELLLYPADGLPPDLARIAEKAKKLDELFSSNK